MKKILCQIIVAMLFGISFAQDIHFSQYWGSPLNLNPALTGVFDQTIRFNANYRNQWLQQRSFTTYAMSVDANLFKRKTKDNFLGTGLSIYHDIEGKGAFKNTSIGYSLSYNQKFAGRSKTKHYIGIGLQGVYFSKSINLRNAVYNNLFEQGNNFDPIESASFNNVNILDFNLGLSYFSNIDNKHNLGVGFSISHIAEQNIAFGSNNSDILYRKLSIHSSATLVVKNQFLAVIPTFLFQKQGPHSEIDAGAYFRFTLNDYKNMFFYCGAQYRISVVNQNGYSSDAFIPGIRFGYDALDIGLTYDITLSQLRNVNNFIGGPELYLIYGISNNKGRSKSSVNCPKF